MKKIKGIKSSKTKEENENATKRKANAARIKSTIGPEEYEEQRSMNIRMKPQPFKK